MFRALVRRAVCLLIIATAAGAVAEEPRRVLVLLTDFGATERVVTFHVSPMLPKAIPCFARIHCKQSGSQ